MGSSPEAPQASSKKARMHSDSGLSAPATSSGLGDVSATFLFINTTVESLRPLFDSRTVDPMVDLRVVNIKAIRNMFIQLYKWLKDLEMQNSLMPIQLRRHLFSNGTISSLKHLLILDSTPWPIYLPLSYLRMRTHPPHPKSILSVYRSGRVTGHDW